MVDVPKFTTLGCRLNAYETHAMEELSQQAGLFNGKRWCVSKHPSAWSTP